MHEYAKKAIAAHAQGYNCCQCVLLSMCDELGIDKKTAVKLGGAMGSGIAAAGKTCGAVTGAIMLIGYKYGKEDPDIKPEFFGDEPRCYAIGTEFMRRFKEKYKTVECSELIGADISTVAGREFRAKDHNKCNAFIAFAAEQAAQIIKEEDEGQLVLPEWR